MMDEDRALIILIGLGLPEEKGGLIGPVHGRRRQRRPVERAAIRNRTDRLGAPSEQKTTPVTF